MAETVPLIYKGLQYRSLREINDPDFAYYNTEAVRTPLHFDQPLGKTIVARDMDGMTYLAWTGASLMPARKTFDMAIAAACLLDGLGRPVSLVDIGTGTGVFPITVSSLLEKQATCIATDVSEDALHVASINAQINGLKQGSVIWKKTDGLAGISALVEGFDLVFSNPPFTRAHEVDKVNRCGFNPALALDGGADGSLYYRQFAEEAIPMLNKEGVLIFQLPLDVSGIRLVIQSVYSLFPSLPIHLLTDSRSRYAEQSRKPLFMSIGGRNSQLCRLQEQKYHVEQI